MNYVKLARIRFDRANAHTSPHHNFLINGFMRRVIGDSGKVSKRWFEWDMLCRGNCDLSQCVSKKFPL
jgi:hypothetical protein